MVSFFNRGTHCSGIVQNPYPMNSLSSLSSMSSLFRTRRDLCKALLNIFYSFSAIQIPYYIIYINDQLIIMGFCSSKIIHQLIFFLWLAQILLVYELYCFVTDKQVLSRADMYLHCFCGLARIRAIKDSRQLSCKSLGCLSDSSVCV